MKRNIKIREMIASENHKRMKALILIFLFLGVYNVIIDFSSLNLWDEHVNEIFKFLDISLSLICLSSAFYFWIFSKQNPKLSEWFSMVTIALVVMWSVLICGLDYNSTGFSTYLGTVLLSLLFLHFKPIFSIFLIWISTILLLTLVFILSQDSNDSITIAIVMTPINLIGTYIFFKNYKEKVNSFSLFLEKEELNEELISAKENLDKKVEIRTRELVNAKDKAEESERLKSAFLANMSHEIRTPMNGILGFAELLKKPHLSDQQQQKYIQIIEKSGARMLNIINDIVNISKIESGTMDIYITEININKQFQFVYDTLAKTLISS
jgi:signal transduction histidine kinase